MSDRTASYQVDGAYDLSASWALLSLGHGDPCLRIDAPNRFAARPRRAN